MLPYVPALRIYKSYMQVKGFLLLSVAQCDIQLLQKYLPTCEIRGCLDYKDVLDAACAHAEISDMYGTTPKSWIDGDGYGTDLRWNGWKWMLVPEYNIFALITDLEQKLSKSGDWV